MVFIAALLASLTTTYIVFGSFPISTPTQQALHDYLALQGGTILPIIFLVYWGLALLLLAQWRSYQRLLTELADVRTQVERARRLDQLKDQFIRNVNHELRTPIMALLGYVDLLKNPETQRSAEKVERYVQRAERAGQSLRALLAGILDTRRLGVTSSALAPERLDLMTVLEEVIPLIPDETGGQNTVERALQVRMPSGLAVWAEGIKTQQIFINLLANAVKYSEPGTPVNIEARLVKGDESGGRRCAPARDAAGAGGRDHRARLWLGHPTGEPAAAVPAFHAPTARYGIECDRFWTGSLSVAHAGRIHGRLDWRPEQRRAGRGSSFIVRLPAPPSAGPDATTAEEPESDPQDSSLRLVAVRPADDFATGDAEPALSDDRSS